MFLYIKVSVCEDICCRCVYIILKQLIYMNQQYYINKMSNGSIKIYNATKWKRSGFVPSFKNIDEILMEAALRTYK